MLGELSLSLRIAKMNDGEQGRNKDYSSEKFPVHERIVHWLGGRIKISHQKAVESCLIFAMGIKLWGQEPTKKHIRNSLVEQLYKSNVDSLPDNVMDDSTMKDSLKSRLMKAKCDLNGGQLQRRFRDIRKEVRAQYINKLPDGIKDLGSGKSLTEAYDKFVKDRYIDANSRLRGARESDINVPPDWEYGNKSTQYLLVCKVFRNCKHLTTDITTTSPGDSRDNIRKKLKRKHCTPGDKVESRIRLESAKVAIAVNKLQTCKIQGDLAQQQLDNLEKFKSVFPQDVYDKKVKELFDYFPSLATMKDGLNMNFLQSDDEKNDNGIPDFFTLSSNEDRSSVTDIDTLED